MPLVYEELHRLAHRELNSNFDVTLGTTALIHEAYLRLADQKPDSNSRKHFLAIAARLMRQVLVDYFRNRHAKKRGGRQIRVTLNDFHIGRKNESEKILAIDSALIKLTNLDERKGKVVELRFFGGLTVMETAEVLNVSHSTVERDWEFSRAWLYRELQGELR